MADLSGSTQFRSIKTTLPSGLLGGVYFETPGGTPSLLNNYQSQSLTIPFAGVWANPVNVNVVAERIGNAVTLALSGVLQTSTTAGIITSTTALPSIFTSQSTNSVFYQPVIAINSGVNQIGMISVTTQGSMQVSLLGSNFTAGGVAGWLPICITYTLSS